MDDGDGEWFCEMHPDSRYASCDAPVCCGLLGPRYQVSALPAYRGTPKHARGSRRGADSSGGSDELAAGAADGEDDKLGGGGDDDDGADDEDDDVRTRVHARLRPLAVDDLALVARPPRNAAEKRKREKKAPNLPAFDSQRYDNIEEEEEVAPFVPVSGKRTASKSARINYQEMSGSESDGESGGDDDLDLEIDSKYVPRPASATSLPRHLGAKKRRNASSSSNESFSISP